MTLVGITGTFGAGKGEVAQHLTQKHDFTHHSVRAYLAESLGGDPGGYSRDAYVREATRLRTQHGGAYIVEQLVDRASKEGDRAIVESIRSRKEAEYLRESGGVLLYVDAPAQLRYERITARKSDTDHITFGTFCAQERAERYTTNPFAPNVFALQGLADYTFVNDGELTELHSAVESTLLAHLMAGA